MATAPVEQDGDGSALLTAVRADLLEFADSFAAHFLLQGREALAETATAVEELSKVVEHLQVLGAHALAQVESTPAGANGRSGSVPYTASAARPAETAGVKEFRDTADFLRARLHISRGEANRRLKLAAATRPRPLLSGGEGAPPLEVLGIALAKGSVSGRAASLIRDAVERVRPVAEPDQVHYMERHLTRQAVESDEDILRAVARRWENALDQDGREPSEKLLRARQGVFLRGRRNGLHLLEIGATDDQFEHLATVMNTATNPRLSGGGASADGGGSRSGGDGGADGGGGFDGGSGFDGGGAADDLRGDGPADMAPASDRWDEPTRAQRLLDGLVGACKIALAGDGLPAAGGHRPQVMVTIDYRTLLGELLRTPGAEQAEEPGHSGHTEGTRNPGGVPWSGPAGGDSRSPGRAGIGRQGHSGMSGDAVFVQQISARSIRRIACDADLIPLVLGGRGQVLDVGRSQRLFPPHLRRALVARDKGCAFPDCTIPSTWCEAHHIVPWGKGGTTNISDGVLLCSRHHHVIHEGSWSVESRHGVPWFLPPHHLDPDQKPRRNRYWSAGESVHSARVLRE